MQWNKDHANPNKYNHMFFMLTIYWNHSSSKIVMNQNKSLLIDIYDINKHRFIHPLLGIYPSQFMVYHHDYPPGTSITCVGKSSDLGFSRFSSSEPPYFPKDLRTSSMMFNLSLVGGDWNMNFIFPFSWECHHPKWLSYFGGLVNHQPVIRWSQITSNQSWITYCDFDCTLW